ncbi:SWPV2-ORF304 [Shearwaterpox virus]|uniref:SWPV2-ORF304 n=1 Tax=Shearwaterpox virus TaxID=1974596 RepID=A0A1V0QGQ9_CNPV|nr:SWPV2-ORF304 [Shearwaterpox virus]
MNELQKQKQKQKQKQYRFNSTLKKAILNEDRKKLLRMLTKGIDKEVSLLLAVEYRCTWFVKVLLDNGADPNYKDAILCMTPLHVISMFVSLKRLYKIGSISHFISSYVYAPLTENFEKNSINVAEVLLLHGANINDVNLIDQSPLNVAINSNNLSMVKFLLSKGADIGFSDIRGKTPLHHCFQHTYINLGIAKELLSRNANPNMKDIFGSSVLEYALTHTNDAESTSYLIEAGADVNDIYREQSMLQIATIHEREKIVKLLIDYGADINYRDDEGYSSLHYAVSDPDLIEMANLPYIPDVAKILVENGADVNITDNLLETPIFKTPSPAIANYLIENGADINVVNIDGYTLLSSLEPTSSSDILPIIAKFTMLCHFEKHDNNPGFIINDKTISDSRQMTRIKNKCDNEIFRLKAIKLNDGYTADIFLYCRDIDLLSRFVNNRNMLNIHKRFNIYGSYIDKTINNVKERIRILDNAIDFVENINFFRYLPYHIKYSILSKLDNEELIKLSNTHDS